MPDALWFPDALDAQNRAVRLCQVTRDSLADTAFLDERWDRTGCRTRTSRPRRSSSGIPPFAARPCWRAVSTGRASI
jgi:hypothetical protein